MDLKTFGKRLVTQQMGPNCLVLRVLCNRGSGFAVADGSTPIGSRYIDESIYTILVGPCSSRVKFLRDGYKETKRVHIREANSLEALSEPYIRGRGEGGNQR